MDLDAWILEPATGYEEEAEEDEEAQALAVEQEAQIAGAVRTLGEWLAYIRSDSRSDALERYVYRALARDSIRVLRRRLSSAGLAYCDSLLAFEPQMTHTVCRYLSRVASVDADALAFVAGLVARPDTHLSAWQKLWLLEPLLWAPEVPAQLWAWVTPMLDDHTSPLLQARAALSLATHNQIPTTRLGLLFDESTDAAKPDLVVAMVRASDGNHALVSALANENELLRLVSAHAEDAV